jgi:hypothetical protein
VSLPLAFYALKIINAFFLFKGKAPNDMDLLAIGLHIVPK